MWSVGDSRVLRADYARILQMYWGAIRAGNYALAKAVYAEATFYSLHAGKLFYAKSRQAKKNKEKSFKDITPYLPGLLGGVVLVVLVYMTYKGVIRTESVPSDPTAVISSQIAYNIDVVNLIVGAALSFAAIVSALTYVENSNRNLPPDDLDDGPPILPLPPSPDELLPR